MDANDEKPEFQNMPAIADVMEVSRGGRHFLHYCGPCAAGTWWWLLFHSLQTTEGGSSIYKVQAVDKDTGSGGSVTYYFQVPEHDGNVGLHVRQEQLDWSDGGGGGVEIAHIWRQQACTVVEHMGSLHQDGLWKDIWPNSALLSVFIHIILAFVVRVSGWWCELEQAFTVI